MKTKNKIRYMTHAATVAALYVALTLISAAMGLSSGAVQVRLSEALTVLPVFTSAAVPGLALGCFVANLISGCIPVDIIVGTAATLLGAILTRLIGKRVPVLAPIPPIIANSTAIPFVLRYGYGIDGGLWYFALTVGIGEVISCGVFGLVLLYALKKKRIFEEK